MAVDAFASLTLARRRIDQIIGERVKRVQDMRPVMASVARQLEQMSRDAIDRSRSPAGRQFARLAASTLRARKPGEHRIPLKKTGDSYDEIRCFPSLRNGLVMLVPRNLRWHMTAGPRRPKRNAFPFEISAGGKAHPIPKVLKLIRDTTRAHVVAMKPAHDLPLAAE